jgi:hypothetical protein
MQIHFAVPKPGLDKRDRAFVAINPPKLTRRVFEIHILSIDAVSLINRKALVVVFENLKNVHKEKAEGVEGEF